MIAASVSVSAGVPSLLQYAIEPIQKTASQTDISPKSKKEPKKKELGPEAQTVNRALQKIGALRAHVVAAFNPFHLVTRYFEIPFVPVRERQEAARYEATRYIPFKLEETVADFHITERKAKAGETTILGVTCAAARLDLLRSYGSHFRQGTAKVDMVEPLFSAFSRALSASEKKLGENAWGFIFIDGDESVNITLVSRGSVYLSRDFLLTGEDARANETRFYEELKASLDYMKKESGEEHLEQIFLAGTGDLLFWRDFLTSVFGTEARFELAVFPADQSVPAQVIPGLLVAIGLGLRNFSDKSPLGTFTLVPPAELETKPERFKKVIQVEFLLFALFFIVTRFGILEPYAAHIQKQVLKQMSPEAAADSRLVSMSVSELTKLRDDLQASGSQIEKLTKSNLSIGAKLTAISNTLPKAIWLEQLLYESGLSEKGRSDRSGSPTGRALIFRGQCYLANAEEDVKAIDQWVKTLNQDKVFLEGFRKAVVTEVRREKYLDHDTTMFSISCQ